MNLYYLFRIISPALSLLGVVNTLKEDYVRYFLENSGLITFQIIITILTVSWKEMTLKIHAKTKLTNK